MTWTHPDDVPTSLTRRAYALRTPNISQNQYAAVVADAYEDVAAEVYRSIAERAEPVRSAEDRQTPATLAAADLLGMPWEVVADVMDAFGYAMSEQNRERLKDRVKTLTRDNADEIAAWVGGWRAGGAYELVGWGLRGSEVYASPGDTIMRVGGKFFIKTGSTA